VKANVLFFDNKLEQEKPWTKKLWMYDLRTNMHFTPKTKAVNRSHLDDFVRCYHPGNRHLRRATWSEKTADGRWRAFDYADRRLRHHNIVTVTQFRDYLTHEQVLVSIRLFTERVIPAFQPVASP
jgi:type I restriction enzyme M protein